MYLELLKNTIKMEYDKVCNNKNIIYNINTENTKQNALVITTSIFK